MKTDLTLADYRALAELRYQIRAFLAFSEQAARDVGLDPGQHQLLLAIQGLPEGRTPTIGTLAERLQVRHHSAVELVNRAARAGLVQRRRAEGDARQVEVQLLPEGLALLQQLSRVHRAALGAQAPELLNALAHIVAAERA